MILGVGHDVVVEAEIEGVDVPQLALLDELARLVEAGLIRELLGNDPARGTDQVSRRTRETEAKMSPRRTS